MSYEVTITLRGKLVIVETDDPSIYQDEDDEGFPIGEPRIIFNFRVFRDDAELLGLTAAERQFITDELVKDLETICDDRRREGQIPK